MIRILRHPAILLLAVLFLSSCMPDTRENESSPPRGSLSLDLNGARAVILQRGFEGEAVLSGDGLYTIQAGVLKLLVDGSAVPALTFVTKETDVPVPPPSFIVRGTDYRLYLGYEEPFEWQEYISAGSGWMRKALLLCRLGYDNSIDIIEGEGILRPFDAPWLHDYGAPATMRHTAPVRFSPDGNRMAYRTEMDGWDEIRDGDGLWIEELPASGVMDMVAGNQVLGVMKKTAGGFTAQLYDDWDTKASYTPLDDMNSDYWFSLWFEKDGLLHFSGESVTRHRYHEPGETVINDSGLMKYDLNGGVGVIAGMTRTCNDPDEGCQDVGDEYFGFADQAAYYTAFPNRQRFEQVFVAAAGEIYGLIHVEEHGNIVSIMKVTGAAGSFSGEIIADDIEGGSSYALHGGHLYYVKNDAGSPSSLRRIDLAGSEDGELVGTGDGIVIHSYDVDVHHNMIYMIATRANDSAAGYAVHVIGGTTVFYPEAGLNSASEVLCVDPGPAGVEPLVAAIDTDVDSGIDPLDVQFDGSASGGTPPYSYSWDFGYGIGSTEEDPDRSYPAGEYTAILTVTDYYGVTATSTKEIRVLNWYDMTVEIGAEITGTPDDIIVEFSADITGGAPPYTYKWNFDVDDAYACEGMPQNSPDNAPFPVHSYCWNGVYNVTLVVEDSSGNSAYDSIVINNRLEGSPLVDVSMNPWTGTGTAPLTVYFSSAVSDGTSPYHYYWSFDDGSAGVTTQDAEHTYTNPGEYYPCLRVFNADYGYDTIDFVRVVVTP